MTEAYPAADLYRRVVAAKLYIDEQFASDMELDNIAGQAFFSKFHFIRQFKKIYGRTPHQYRTAVRVNRAKQLLARGMTVTSACYDVGFDSVASFTILFRKLTGFTPAAFQKKQIAIARQMKDKPLSFVPACYAAYMA